MIHIHECSERCGELRDKRPVHSHHIEVDGVETGEPPGEFVIRQVWAMIGAPMLDIGEWGDVVFESGQQN